MNTIKPEYLNFLKRLSENNNREWFKAHKAEFDPIYADMKLFFEGIYKQIAETDDIGKFQVHRIYRFLRYSKDKTPFRTHFRLYLRRTKPLLRGGYYLYIQPGNNRIIGGVGDPTSGDLLRIRKELAADDKTLRKILTGEQIKKYFGRLQGEETKTAPRGFAKDSSGIDLIRKKQFLLQRNFTDMEVLSPDFQKEVVNTFKALRPFFDYLSEVLTTDENGESLYESTSV